MTRRYAPIEDYGIIGDLHTVALVGKDGSIDFLCLPSFDSPSVFAALLDADRGGRFQIAPQLDDAVHRQLYLPDTNVLLTRFLSDSGVAEVSDFMPVEDAGVAHNLVRRAKTVRGEVRFAMRCEPRFDYARATHTAERRSEKEILFVGRSGPRELALRLRSSIPLQLADGAAVAEFTLGADQSAWFVLEVVTAEEPSPSERPDYANRGLQGNRQLLARLDWPQHVQGPLARDGEPLGARAQASHLAGSTARSSRPPPSGCPRTSAACATGTIATPGSATSSFTLYGLMRLGYTSEAADFMRWIEARCHELGPEGSLQIMYGIDGRHDLPEETLPPPRGLHGLASSPHRQRGARPASARHLWRADGLGLPVRQVRRARSPTTCGSTRPAASTGSAATGSSRTKASGRCAAGVQEFLYSRVMCWVGHRPRHPPGASTLLPRAASSRWFEVRDAIYRDIFERLLERRAPQAFVQYEGASDL